MSRPATSRLKCNAPLGRMPVLQFIPPAELRVDAVYQRSLDAESSKSLIRKIAQFWNWDLCQPLVVARRANGDLFVIDGQHRLEGARMRGDIAQLPCVVVEYASAADEAASFVHLNQQRRPLTRIDLFKAAVASEDPEACAILAALERADLAVAPHSNYTAWKPGMVANIGGIEASWRRHGARSTERALVVLGRAWKGEVLRYAGTLFPGIAAICGEDGDGLDVAMLCDMLASETQDAWRRRILQRRTDNPNLKFAAASAEVLSEAWDEWIGALYGEEEAA
ncbi:ParB N-terminal domain-containing protein [Pelagerythrobacter marinus]|nr:ParB N-terminal domain-containing protein [Pelagerythrobacter marinus]